MFSSVMKEYTESSKGFLFESFMALVLKGSNVEGTVIQDIEIMAGDESDATKRVSLKLLKADSPIKGSLTNLYRSVTLVMNSSLIPILLAKKHFNFKISRGVGHTLKA